MPCSLPSRITTKVLKNCKTFFKTKTKTNVQDQDQNFHFCPRGTSIPRPWSRGLHHCQISVACRPVCCSHFATVRRNTSCGVDLGTNSDRMPSPTWVAVAGRWTCDQQVSGSTLSDATLGKLSTTNRCASVNRQYNLPAMSCVWNRNCGSGVAPAMQHGLLYFHLLDLITDIERGISTPPAFHWHLEYDLLYVCLTDAANDSRGRHSAGLELRFAR